MILDGYLAMADICATLLRAPEVAARWEQPSALPEFRVSGLAGHLAQAGVFRVHDFLAVEVPDDEPTDAVGYYVSALKPGTPADDPIAQRIRDAGEQHAANGPAALADKYDAVLAEIRPTLSALPQEHRIMTRLAVVPLDQWLVTRMIEFGVHADDLAVSVGLRTPEFPADANDIVITALARIAAAHHGPVATIRALSRRERVTAPITAF